MVPTPKGQVVSGVAPKVGAVVRRDQGEESAIRGDVLGLGAVQAEQDKQAVPAGAVPVPVPKAGGSPQERVGVQGAVPPASSCKRL